MTDHGSGVVLVLSHQADPYVAMVGNHLDALRAPWALVPTLEVGDVATASWRCDDRGPAAVITTPDGAIDTSQVTAVWNRRWLRPHLERYESEPTVRQYAAEQWWHTLDAVLRLADARWINPVQGLARARSKPDQLVEARRLGLETPPTLVGADVNEVRSFAGDLGLDQLITKVVSPGTPIVDDPQDQYMVFTQRIDVADLDAASVAAAPAIYQPELTKVFEVRATVVGDDVFGCQIDSMASEATCLDWRHYDFDQVAHTPIELPTDVRDSLLSLCEHYGLSFGAADFVVQPDGRWVFLELNANGQWGWIEEQAGLPISERLARELVR